jgi:sugar phosphate isomerase/epimerase
MTYVPDLIAAYGTLRRAAFPDRVCAAAAAGFRSIGLTTVEYAKLLGEGWTDELMRQTLDRFGMTISEAEYIVGFWAEPGPAGVPGRPALVYADVEAEKLIYRMADEFGVSVMQAVGTFDSRELGDEVPEAFAALCDRAKPHGLDVALEFVPYTSIPDLQTARGIVAAAGRANGGLCVDTWHFFRGGSDVEELTSLDPAMVKMIQVNDGPAVPTSPDRMYDTVSNRVCPGEGDFPVADFLRALWSCGVDIPLSVEIYSLALERYPSGQIAERAATRTWAVAELAAAGLQ